MRNVVPFNFRGHAFAAEGDPADPACCAYCGATLRPFRWRYLEHAIERGRKLGAYGDNTFCSLRCGYRFGIAMAQNGMQLTKKGSTS